MGYDPPWDEPMNNPLALPSLDFNNGCTNAGTNPGGYDIMSGFRSIHTGGCHFLFCDGSVRFVIAHRDPGVPNWLDTAGHQRGTVGVRWVGPDVVDVLPTTSVVELSSFQGGE